MIEEYTRPARYIENGKTIVKPALSDPELLDFPEIGTLEAFNTDGLRTLARTLAGKIFTRKGICPPEYIGRDEKACRFMLRTMEERNIIYRETVTERKTDCSGMIRHAKVS